MAGIIVWLLVAKRTSPDWIINTALASGTLFVVLMLGLIALRGFPLEELRSRNFFMALGRQSNSLGGMLMILLPCALYMWTMATGPLRRLVLAGITLALVTGITLSASRGAILAMLVVFALYALEFRRFRAIFAGALVLSAAALMAPESVQERMFQGLDDRTVAMGASVGFQDEVTSGRLYIWSRLAPEIIESPVIGGGLGSSQWSQFARSGEYFAAHPHSFYLELLMDTGIVGAVIVFLLYRYLWRSFRMLGRDERLSVNVRGYFRGASIGLLGYVAYGVVNGHWYPSQDQVYLWVAAGLVIGMRAVLGALPSEAPVRPKPVHGRGGWRPSRHYR
jgi:O-antigen ligase